MSTAKTNAATLALPKRETRNSIVHFFTTSDNKMRETVAILNQGTALPVTLKHQKAEIPELQGTPDYVAKKKCLSAAKRYGGAILVEDTGLFFNAIRNFPGIYVKSFLRDNSPEIFYKTLMAFEDKTAQATCTFAYCSGMNSEPILFTGTVNGTIVAPRGSQGFGWDSIFQPEGSELTFAEMTPEEKNRMSPRYFALMKVKEHFLNTQQPKRKLPHAELAATAEITIAEDATASVKAVKAPRAATNAKKAAPKKPATKKTKKRTASTEAEVVDQPTPKKRAIRPAPAPISEGMVTRSALKRIVDEQKKSKE